MSRAAIPDLHVHFIDCGQGNMTLIVTPAQEVFLYDCRVTEENSDRIRNYLWDYIPRRLDRDGKERRWIDWFLLSHRDKDHFHGLAAVNAAFPIRGIIDPGTTSGSTEGDEYLSYTQLKRDIKQRLGARSVLEPRPSYAPLFSSGGAELYCICSGVDDQRSDDGHYGNLVVVLQYAGRRVLLTGDSDWRAWREKIMPAFAKTGLLKVHVLVGSHHGSRTFFTDADPFEEEDDAWKRAYHGHLDLLAPEVTILSCGDYDTCHHPNERALEIYRKVTPNGQVHLTRDKGTLIGRFHADGSWTVTPARFLDGWNYRAFGPQGTGLDVVCERKTLLGGYEPVANGSCLPVGSKLRFKAIPRGGLIGNIAKANFVFEVSNGGVGPHASHQEVYFKAANDQGDPNHFYRSLDYRGTHLLRVTARDHRAPAHREAQQVFVIHGVA